MRDPIIEYRGEVLAKQGYGTYARKWLKDIVDDIKLVSKEEYVPPDQKIEDSFWIQQIVKSSIKSSPDILLHFSIPPNWTKEEGKFNIGCALWDGFPYPEQWAGIINNTVDAIVVPTYGMKHALAPVTDLPVKIFKPKYDLSYTSKAVEKVIPGTEDKVRFFYRGDFNYLSGVKELVRAFSIAFGSQKDVVLILKLDLPNADPNMQHAVRGNINQFLQGLVGIPSSNIKVLTDDLPDEEVFSLQKGCHYFFSLEKSIGIDIRVMEAAACGLPIISPELFNREIVSLPIESHKSPCVEFRGNLWSSRQWIQESHMDSTFEVLRAAYATYREDKDTYKKYKKDLETQVAWLEHDTDLLEVCKGLKEKARQTYMPSYLVK